MKSNNGSYQQVMEEKHQEEEQPSQPASPYMLAQMKEKLMRKYSTTYQPKRKAA